MEDKDKKIVSLHLKLMPYLEKYGILLLLVIMILVMHILQPDVFLSWRNVTNVFKQISWQSMLALGVFMVIVTAGIDLSVGSIMMLSFMICGLCYMLNVVLNVMEKMKKKKYMMKKNKSLC